MSLKGKKKLLRNDNNYRAIVVASSIWEGCLAIMIYLSYSDGNKTIMWILILLFIFEMFSVGSKLMRYEKNHFNML